MQITGKGALENLADPAMSRRKNQVGLSGCRTKRLLGVTIIEPFFTDPIPVTMHNPG
jgi:hypothetical protein